ncbi:histidine kinase [Sphingosinicella sp. LHD-64]|uniref:sensor histidine kinase n=1 Tax=Sphingosinicella sp. LHD-64 TaxID=3072139 RepID=UPI0028107E79|nr:histidine kinase [Sphingosinicella sp. LHD-64]MDQ8755721.1 histidine kinase [Sphingosinicella sp. LHD-64]
MSDPPARGTLLVQIGCTMLIAAAGLRAYCAGAIDHAPLTQAPNWALNWTAGYLVFIAAYSGSHLRAAGAGTRIALLLIQSLSATYLLWLYPNFIVTVLFVVTAWRIAWTLPLGPALGAIAVQSAVLAGLKYLGPAQEMSPLVLVTTGAFELFAVSVAHLARNETVAKEQLERTNAQLRTTQAFLTENAQMAERLRLSRDLHDALGHNLTSLAIRLDVAGRMARGEAGDHIRTARRLASGLLDDVRDVVANARVAPVDLKARLVAIVAAVDTLDVRLNFSGALSAVDGSRADVIIRCVQELITNA